ncbi:MAG: alginate lyase family protein [Nitrospira sp.]|nr:MAG: alginate lyase family protein [Nitrospira sp.]
MKRIGLYFNTVRYLRARQIYALIRNRLFPQSVAMSFEGTVAIRSVDCTHAFIVDRSPVPDEWVFSFLNRSKRFVPGSIDWASSDMPKLWRYNLHYFDYLFQEKRSSANKEQLISSWITHNPPGAGDAWEPYTLSLRIVNWIKYFRQSRHDPPDEWKRSLYHQVFWLERNLEYHLMANHLFKNGVALCIAGLYFEGNDAERWLAKGRGMIREELSEQILQDGGHFERSPMYHAIWVVDCLDMLNILQLGSHSMPLAEASSLRKAAIKGVQFLEDICLSDGEIPLFNDAAAGIAPSTRDILTYATAILGYVRSGPDNQPHIVCKEPCGYYVIRHDTDIIVIDCGPVGPDYQPGHAHADTLSFELALDGRRVVVDTGVYDYEPGSRRAYARSTRAHNTVCVDGQDQSEVWGVFRVARRAYPLYASLTSDRPGHALFLGAHDGYHRLPGRVTHERMIEYASPGMWTVRDTLSGKGEHSLESYLHLHPEYEPHIVAGGVEVRDRTGRVHMMVEPPANATVSIQSGFYFPEFGKEIENSIIVMAYRGRVPVTLTYRMLKTVTPQ